MTTAARAWGRPLAAAAAAGAVAALAAGALPVWRLGLGLALAVVVAGAVAASGPLGAAALLILAVYFPQGAAVGGAVISPPDVAVVLVLVAWLPAMAARGRWRVARTAGDAPWALMILAACISVAAGAVRGGEVPLARGLREIGQLLLFAGLYTWAATELAAPGRLRWAAGLFLAVSCAEALYALAFQYAPSLSSIGASYVQRTTGTADAGFGAFMAAGLVMAVALGGHASPRWRLPARAAVVCVLLAGVMSTGTRGAAVAAGVGIALVLIASRRRWVTALTLAAALAALAMVAFWFPDLGRASRIAYRVGEPITSGGIQRMIGWRLGLDIAARHPVFGAGPGANAEAFPVLSGAPAFVIDHVEGAFNAYIQALMETGPLGLLGLLAFVVLVVAAAVRAYRRAPKTPSATIGFACACGMAAVAVTGVTGPLIMAGVGHLFFLLAGLAAAGARAAQGEADAA